MTIVGFRPAMKIALLTCGSLPFQEFEIDKTLNIRGPEDVAKMGIEAYNAECRKIVMRYSNEWETIITRLGRWIGML